MGLNDSPVYRGSQDLTQTLLSIARLNQYRKQLDLEEQERQRRAGIEAEEMGRKRTIWSNEDADRARVDTARRGVDDVFAREDQLNVQEVSPDPTGGAPLLQPGYGTPAATLPRRGFDAGELARVLFRMKPDLAADPQGQLLLQQSGKIPSPEAMKLQAQQADRQQRSRGVALALQDRYPNKTMDELLEIASAVPVGDADTWGRLPIHAQQANTGSRGMDLRWADANLDTKKSQFNADVADRRVKSFAENIESLIQDRAATQPTRIERQAAGADASRATADQTRKMTPSKVEGSELSAQEKRETVKYAGPQAAANLEKTRKETSQIGQPKAAAANPLVQAQLTKIRALKAIPGTSGKFGTSWGSTSAQSIGDQVEDMKNTANDDVTRRAIDIAYDHYLQEQMEGGGQVGTTAPVAAPAKTKTAIGPNGQRLELQNGKWVPIGR